MKGQRRYAIFFIATPILLCTTDAFIIRQNTIIIKSKRLPPLYSITVGDSRSKAEDTDQFRSRFKKRFWNDVRSPSQNDNDVNNNFGSNEGTYKPGKPRRGLNEPSFGDNYYSNGSSHNMNVHQAYTKVTSQPQQQTNDSRSPNNNHRNANVVRSNQFDEGNLNKPSFGDNFYSNGSDLNINQSRSSHQYEKPAFQNVKSPSSPPAIGNAASPPNGALSQNIWNNSNEVNAYSNNPNRDSPVSTIYPTTYANSAPWSSNNPNNNNNSNQALKSVDSSPSQGSASATSPEPSGWNNKNGVNTYSHNLNGHTSSTPEAKSDQTSSAWTNEGRSSSNASVDNINDTGNNKNVQINNGSNGVNYSRSSSTSATTINSAPWNNYNPTNSNNNKNDNINQASTSLDLSLTKQNTVPSNDAASTSSPHNEWNNRNGVNTYSHNLNGNTATATPNKPYLNGNDRSTNMPTSSGSFDTNTSRSSNTPTTAANSAPWNNYNPATNNNNNNNNNNNSINGASTSSYSSFGRESATASNGVRSTSSVQNNNNNNNNINNNGASTYSYNLNGNTATATPNKPYLNGNDRSTNNMPTSNGSFDTNTSRSSNSPTTAASSAPWNRYNPTSNNNNNNINRPSLNLGPSINGVNTYSMNSNGSTTTTPQSKPGESSASWTNGDRSYPTTTMNNRYDNNNINMLANIGSQGVKTSPSSRSSTEYANPAPWNSQNPTSDNKNINQDFANLDSALSRSTNFDSSINGRGVASSIPSMRDESLKPVPTKKNLLQDQMATNKANFGENTKAEEHWKLLEEHGPSVKEFTEIWDSVSPVIVQGSSLKTCSFNESVNRLQLLLKTEGRPLHSTIEIWQGPNNTPQKMKVYIDDGNKRPIRLVVETPNNSNILCIRNSGEVEFPISVGVDGSLKGVDGEAEGGPAKKLSSVSPAKRIQGGSTSSTPFLPCVSSVQVMLDNDGLPLNAKIEILQGPNNPKQSIEVYIEDGKDRPFYCVFETPEGGSVVRITNTSPVEFPLNARTEPYSLKLKSGESLSKEELFKWDG